MTSSPVLITFDELVQIEWESRGLRLFQNKRSRSHLSGQFHSRFMPSGMEFAQIREYQAGDDIRHMDWRVMAKTRKPYIKCYEEERDRPFFIVIDRRSSMRFGTRVVFKSMQAAKIAALLAWSASGAGYRVGGVVLTDREAIDLPPRRGRKGVLALLQCIAKTDECEIEKSHTIWREGLEVLNRLIKPGAFFIQISDFIDIDKSALPYLGSISKHNQGAAIQVYDDLEKSAPPSGNYAISDGKQFFSWQIQSQKSKEAYHAQYLAWQDNLVSLLNESQIRLLPLNTRDCHIQSAAQFFR